MVRAWFCITVFSLLTLTVAAQSPNGRNVNLVIFGTGGVESGSFRLSAPGGEWLETAADHREIRFRFREVERDEWSVYLRDAARGVDIQLDLYTKKVMYSDAAHPTRRELASILEANAKMNGWLVSRVMFAGNPGGSFSQTGGQWIERANGSPKPRFRFRETGRDDWSVYLRDDSRGVDIQIDLHTGNIYYSDPATPRRVQYQIQKSS
jgi:hypothetical protein